MAIDISQTIEAKRLEAEVNRLYAVFATIAEHVTAAYKAAGRPRPGGYFKAESKEYQVYQNLLEDKQEAYRAWMRAASQHGHYTMPKSKEA